MKNLNILTAKKGELNQKAAERIARQLKRNQERLVDNLDAKRDSLLAKKEELEMITVETSETKLESWANDYQKALVYIKLIDAEIAIANETLKYMFNDKNK